jgi:menaquinone-dependent protoporphyrinogen oxidase
MAEDISRRRFLILGRAAVGAAALGGAGYVATWAPETGQPHTSMGAGMSSVLVVYGTGTGCTTGVAERIGTALAGGGAKVDVVSAKDSPDPTAYDAVVVGSGVRMSQWHEPVRKWVASRADTLKTMPVAFYTVNLTLAMAPERRAEIRAWTDPLVDETGVKPIDVGVFAGWYEPGKFSFIERAIMGAMKAPRGDFRDWNAIDEWTKSVAPTLLEA